MNSQHEDTRVNVFIIINFTVTMLGMSPQQRQLSVDIEHAANLYGLRLAR